MQSGLKKSLYLGLAALSFGAVATLSTTANAKSYATAGAYTTLKTDPTTRNVEATGTNALYTKPGTVKGAKVVASKATMAKLASSKSSADYFRAYGVKTTNRGSVYYRVVTMNGKYRGYVYGGKSTTAFAGGIKTANTTTSANLPSQVNNYYLKDVSKNTIWTAPKNTQYHASKVSLYGVSKSDKFSIDKAATKTREGSLYYHVTDTANSAISGWIYAGGLTTTTAATADNSVTIKYVDSNYNQLGSATFVTTLENTKSGSPLTTDLKDFTDFCTSNMPKGYMQSPSQATPTAANYGSTIQVQVVAAQTSKVNFIVEGSETTDTKNLTATDLNGGKFPALTATQQKVFTGQEGTDIDMATLVADPVFAANGPLNTLTGATQTDANGVQSYNVYTFDSGTTQGANTNAKFGDTVKAYYTVTTEKGAAPSTSVDNGNTNYVD